ncbi:MAG: hypothetical protein WCC04_19045 [Terriglobales bacterium]
MQVLYFSAILRFICGLFDMTSDDYISAKRYRLKDVKTYEVFVSDFNRIETEASATGTHLQFATFWLAIGIGSALTVIALPAIGLKAYLTYLVFAAVGLSLGIFHCLRWQKQGDSLKKLMDGIRESQGMSLGEKGDELKPSELENLPSEEAKESGTEK